jgi:uncharacterized protein with FMN-binding domain
MEPEPNNNSIIKKSITGVLTLGLITGIGMYLSQSKNKGENMQKEDTVITTTPPPTPTAPVATNSNNPVNTSAYKAGTYSTMGSYDSPAGNETFSISLTLADDTITNATFTGNADNQVSKKWQADFAAGFDQAVVGKSIDSLSLTIVNGASLTSQGFINALATIKKESKI